MEQLDDPAVVSWARAQGDYTRTVLGDAAAGVAADAVPPAMREVAIEASRYQRLPSGKALFLARMADDPVDALYLVTQRFFGDDEPFFIERMNDRLWASIEDVWCVDCALSYPRGSGQRARVRGQ